MREISFSEAQENIEAVFDEAAQDANCTLITMTGTEDVVLMPLSHYNSLMETLYLMGSPANAARLGESIRQLEAGQTVECELKD
jgi:antitoxin YefM